MKKKFFRLSATGLLFFSGVMEIGWRFFNMVVCCKRGGRKKERRKKEKKRRKKNESKAVGK